MDSVDRDGGRVWPSMSSSEAVGAGPRPIVVSKFESGSPTIGSGWTAEARSRRSSRSRVSKPPVMSLDDGKDSKGMDGKSGTVA